MNYIIVPTEIIKELPSDRLEELHLSPIQSVDGTKTVLKCCHFQELFGDKLIIMLDEDGDNETISYPYEVYDNKAIIELMDSPEWCESDI